MVHVFSQCSLAPAVKHFKTVDGAPSDYLGSFQLPIGCNKRWLQATPRSILQIAQGFYPEVAPGAFPNWFLNGLEDALRTAGFKPDGGYENEPTWVWEEAIDKSQNRGVASANKIPQMEEQCDWLDYPLVNCQ